MGGASCTLANLGMAPFEAGVGERSPPPPPPPAFLFPSAVMREVGGDIHDFRLGGGLHRLPHANQDIGQQEEGEGDAVHQHGIDPGGGLHAIVVPDVGRVGPILEDQRSPPIRPGQIPAITPKKQSRVSPPEPASRSQYHAKHEGAQARAFPAARSCNCQSGRAAFQMPP